MPFTGQSDVLKVIESSRFLKNWIFTLDQFYKDKNFYHQMIASNNTDLFITILKNQKNEKSKL